MTLSIDLQLQVGWDRLPGAAGRTGVRVFQKRGGQRWEEEEEKEEGGKRSWLFRTSALELPLRGPGWNMGLCGWPLGCQIGNFAAKHSGAIVQKPKGPNTYNLQIWIWPSGNHGWPLLTANPFSVRN